MRGSKEALVETGKGMKPIRVCIKQEPSGRHWDLIPPGNTLEYSSVIQCPRDKKLDVFIHTSSDFAWGLHLEVLTHWHPKTALSKEKAGVYKNSCWYLEVSAKEILAGHVSLSYKFVSELS